MSEEATSRRCAASRELDPSYFGYFDFSIHSHGARSSQRAVSGGPARDGAISDNVQELSSEPEAPPLI